MGPRVGPSRFASTVIVFLYLRRNIISSQIMSGVCNKFLVLGQNTCMPFTEPEDSLPCPQQPTTRFYPAATEYGPHPRPNTIRSRLIIKLPSHLFLDPTPFSHLSSFRTKNLVRISHIYPPYMSRIVPTPHFQKTMSINLWSPKINLHCRYYYLSCLLEYSVSRDRDLSNAMTNDTRQILSQTQLTLFRGYTFRIEPIHHRALTQ